MIDAIIAPRIKICGLTRAEDALCAQELGATALGFIFHAASPRCLSIEQAQAIIHKLHPWVLRVGVFAGEPPQTINAIAQACALDRIQVHGAESAAALRMLCRPSYRAVRPREHAELQELSTSTEQTLMLDTWDEKLFGGTGRPANWAWAHELGRTHRVILSGGLNAENIAEAWRQARPYAVDASSGLESAPGIKDESKMRAFFAALHAAVQP